MKYNFDRSFTFKLGEHTWEAYLVTQQEMGELTDNDEDRENGLDEDTPAYVEPENRCLFFQEQSVTIEDIRHELWHAWQEMFRIESAKLDVDQYEEVVAEFLGNDINVYLTKVQEIYDAYMELEGVS